MFSENCHKLIYFFFQNWQLKIMFVTGVIMEGIYSYDSTVTILD